MSRRHWFWTLQLAGWTVYGLLVTLFIMTVVSPDRWLRVFGTKMLRAGMGLGFSLVLYLLYERWIAAPRPAVAAALSRPGRRALAIAAGLLAPVVCALLWVLCFVLAVFAIRGIPLDTYDWSRFPNAAMEFSFTLYTWTGAYFAIRYWTQSQTREKEAIEARALAHEAHFLALSYQLNPHFLFNAMNSIRGLILEDPRRARDMVTLLAQFLRHGLMSKPQEETTLARELEAVRHYFAIEKIRFEGKLDVVFDIEEQTADCLVPSLILNPLAENAIKHGQSGPDGVLRVRLTTRVVDGRLRIEMENTGRLGLRGSSPSRLASPHEDGNTGLGLDNIEQRLRHRYGDRGGLRIHQAGGRVRVTVELDVVRASHGAIDEAPAGATVRPKPDREDLRVPAFAVGASGDRGSK